MKSSLMKNTLCALLLATTLSSVSAQKKKSPSLLPVARAGAGISSKLNPIVSLGVGLGHEVNRSNNNYSISGNVGIFIGETPLRKYYESFSVNKDWLDKVYTVENKIIPLSEYDLVFSSEIFSIGGGVIRAKKSGHSLKSPYSVPDGDLYSISSGGYGILVWGYSLKGGVNITKFFPEIKIPLYIEFTMNGIPKTKGERLPEKIRSGDKGITSFSFGVVGEFKGAKR